MIYKHRTSLRKSWKWYLTHPWEICEEFYSEIKYFLQRGWRGYADCDVWGFDLYLTELMADGLKILSEGIGYPGQGEMNTAKRWERALKLNAKRFQDVIDYEEVGWETDKNYKKRMKVYKEQKEALKFIVKWFNNLWD